MSACALMPFNWLIVQIYFSFEIVKNNIDFFYNSMLKWGAFTQFERPKYQHHFLFN